MRKMWKKILLIAVIIGILTIGGIGIYYSFNHIEQKVVKTAVELGARVKFSAKDYLAGSNYILAKCKVDDSKVDTKTLGNYKLKISCGKKEYIVDVEVLDTTPPKIDIYDTCIPIVIGRNLKTDTLIENCCAVNDFSLPIEVTFLNGSNTMEVTENMINEKGNVEVVLMATDSLGNTSQQKIEFTGIVLKESDIPAWCNGMQEEWKNAILFDVNDKVMSGENATVDEAMAELAEMWGYEKSEKGEKLASMISIGTIGNNCINYENALYNGIGYMPENVLYKFSSEGWKFYVTDEDLEEKYGIKSPIEGDKIIGCTTCDEKRIEVNIGEQTPIDNIETNKLVVVHEFGHFVDYICGGSSKKKEMLNLYKEVSEKNGKVENINLVQNEDRQIYRAYSFTSKEEFFADSFAYCILEPEIMQTQFPEVYEYIIKCIESI